MKATIKVLKITGISLLALIGIVAVIVTLTITLHPAFGDKPSTSRQEAFLSTGHYENGAFVNLIATSMDMDYDKISSILSDYANGIEDQRPQNPLPVLHPEIDQILRPSDSLSQIIWFGHSAFLLQLESTNILLDPMFGPTPAPLTFLGSNRFSDGLPIELEQLPQIDVLILSHDHYDHLDYPSMKKLKDKVSLFVVPLGVGTHLESWGIPADHIRELDWWTELNLASLKLVCTPSRHFSGRGLTDRNATLWSSWVIQSDSQSIYFSGDGGYGPHFREIGERYGPFDFAMMECGQYDLRWHDIHMLPEETAQAAIDVQTEVFMPIHWGSFVLALHSWYDPVERVTKAAQNLNQDIIVPQIGEIVDLNNPTVADYEWWRKVN